VILGQQVIFSGWGQCTELTLTLLAGKQERNLAHKKPVPLIPKGSFPEQVEDNYRVATK